MEVALTSSDGACRPKLRQINSYDGDCAVECGQCPQFTECFPDKEEDQGGSEEMAGRFASGKPKGYPRSSSTARAILYGRPEDVKKDENKKVEINSQKKGAGS